MVYSLHRDSSSRNFTISRRAVLRGAGGSAAAASEWLVPASTAAAALRDLHHTRYWSGSQCDAGGV